MAENNAICAVCGKPYRVCRTCKEQELGSWKTVADTEKCFKVFTVLHQYNVLKNISKEDAKKTLTSLNIQYENYPTNIKDSIDSIMVEPKAVVKHVKEVVTEKVVEAEIAPTAVPVKQTNEKFARKSAKK